MKIQIHESLGPLLRGIGLTVVLIGTVLATMQTRGHEQTQKQAHAARSGAVLSGSGSTNNPQDKSLAQLSQEIEELRDAMQDEATVEDVLRNPWFDVLGILGSTITTCSFYAEWLNKRQKPPS